MGEASMEDRQPGGPGMDRAVPLPGTWMSVSAEAARTTGAGLPFDLPDTHVRGPGGLGSRSSQTIYGQINVVARLEPPDSRASLQR